MSDPDRFQALMLEHLYGLLDADEARELEAYPPTPAVFRPRILDPLWGLPAGEGARERGPSRAPREGAGRRPKAEGWRGGRGEAALVGFPALGFEPPSKPAAPEPVRPAAPQTTA